MLIKAGYSANPSKVPNFGQRNSHTLLPDDILLRIFSFLDRYNLFQMMFVCKQWNRAAGNLWQEKLVKHIENKDFMDVSCDGDTKVFKKGYVVEWSRAKLLIEGEEQRCYLADFLENSIVKYFDTHSNEEVLFAVHSPNGKLASLGISHVSSASHADYWKERAAFEDLISFNFSEIFLTKGSIEIAFIDADYLYGEFAIMLKFLQTVHTASSRPETGEISINLIGSQYADLQVNEKVEKALKTFQSELLANLLPGFCLTVRVFVQAEDYQDYIAEKESKRPDCVIAIEPNEQEFVLEKLAPNILGKYGFSAILSGSQLEDQEPGQLALLDTRRVLENEEGDCMFIHHRRKMYIQGSERRITKFEFDINYSGLITERSLVSELDQFIQRGTSQNIEAFKLLFKDYFLPGPFHQCQLEYED